MQSFKIIKPIHILTPYVRYYWILEDDADVSVSELYQRAAYNWYFIGVKGFY